jgi:hypothetical protein
MSKTVDQYEPDVESKLRGVSASHTFSAPSCSAPFTRFSRNFSTATSLLLARHRRCPAPRSPPWHSLTHSTRWPNMPEYVVTQPLPSSHLSLSLCFPSLDPHSAPAHFSTCHSDPHRLRVPASTPYVSQRPPPSPCPCQHPSPVSLACRGPRCHKKFFFGVVATTFTPSLTHQTLSLACPQLLCCFRAIFSKHHGPWTSKPPHFVSLKLDHISSLMLICSQRHSLAPIAINGVPDCTAH